MTDTMLHLKLIRDLQVTRKTGLFVDVASGNYNISGTRGYYAGSVNNALSPNATNYVQIDSDGSLIINTTGWVTTALALAEVITGASSITTLIEQRTIIGNHGAGIGTGVWREGVPTGTINGTNDTFELPTVPDMNGLSLILDGKTLHQGASQDYTISGNEVTFTTPPEVGSKLIYKYTESTPISPSPAQQLKVSGGQVDIGTSAAPTVGQTLVAIDGTEAEWGDPVAFALATTTTPVTVSGSLAPSVGEALIATSGTTAEWQELPNRGIYTYHGVATWSNTAATVNIPDLDDNGSVIYKLVFDIKNESGSNPATVLLNVNNIGTTEYDFITENISTLVKSQLIGQGAWTVATIPAGSSLVGEMMLRQKDNSSFVAAQASLALGSMVSGTVMHMGSIDINTDTLISALTFVPSQAVTGTVRIYKLI